MLTVTYHSDMRLNENRKLGAKWWDGFISWREELKNLQSVRADLGDHVYISLSAHLSAETVSADLQVLLHEPRVDD